MKSASPKTDHNDTMSLFFKYPYQANNSILSHLKLHGFSSNVVCCKWKSPNTSVVVITPATAGPKMISTLRGTKIDQRYDLVVELYTPRHENRKPKLEVKKTSITASGHCKLFVGSSLPKYTNEQHIRDHFEKFKTCISNVEVVRDKYTNDCKGYGYVTFTSVEHASEAKRALHRSRLLGVAVNVNFRTSRRQLPPGDMEVYEDEPASVSTDSVVTAVIVQTRPKMPHSLSNVEFKKHFKSFESDITNAFVIREERDHYPRKGQGMIEFSSIKAAEYAVEKMSRTRILGRYEIKHIYIAEDSDSSSEDEPIVLKHRASHKTRSAAIEPVSPIYSNSPAQPPEDLIGQTCIEVQNLDPVFTESQISSMIELPMVSCRRLPPPSNIMIIKCHTLEHAQVVVKKLHNKKHLGKTVSARLIADKIVPKSSDTLNHIEHTTQAASTRTMAAAHKSQVSKKSEEEYCEIIVELELQQWNMLMMADPATKVLQYNEIKEPFINNPDIFFTADHDKQCLRLSGKRGAVENARSFLMKRLKQTIQLDKR